MQWMLYPPFASEGTAGLDVPLVVFNGGQLEALGDLSPRHATFHILLVGEDEQPSLLQVLGGDRGGVTCINKVTSLSKDAGNRTIYHTAVLYCRNGPPESPCIQVCIGLHFDVILTGLHQLTSCASIL